jgi:membrane-associated phospholipid phosphatase
VQIFKKVIYSGRPRPYKYFGDLDIVIPSVPGIEMHSYNSFPSGHTATAFALFFSLIFIIQNKFLVFIFFILAIGVAYSRIYLAQHFPVDVLGGSIIGVITAFSIYPLIYNRNNDWIDKDLLSLIGKK